MCYDIKKNGLRTGLRKIETERKGKKGEGRFGVEKREEEMPPWKNITCWTTKEREASRYVTERTRDGKRSWKERENRAVR